LKDLAGRQFAVIQIQLEDRLDRRHCGTAKRLPRLGKSEKALKNGMFLASVNFSSRPTVKEMCVYVKIFHFKPHSAQKKVRRNLS